MFLSPLVSIKLRPLYYLVKQSRTVRPSVKIGRERFQISIDVRNYNRDEIRVKALTEYVIVEGKQEKKTKNGVIMRQFVRKFKLPEGCVIDKIESDLSHDGILTITAPRKMYDTKYPCETLIPVKYIESKVNRDDPVISPAPKDMCQELKGKSVPDEKKTE